MNTKTSIDRGRPFRSKLIPFFDKIKEMRKKRMTWREIAEELEKHGVKTAPNVIYEFAKRHSKQATPWGFEDEEVPRVKKAVVAPNTQADDAGSSPVTVEPGDLDFENPARAYFNPKPKKE